MNRRLVVAALLVALLAGACSNDRASKAVSAEEGKHFVTDYLRARAGMGLRIRPWYRTLDETLPTVEYLRPNGTKTAVTDLVVAGDIVKVEKGRGFVVPGDDAPSGIPSDFDDKNARWHSVHATVAVDHAIGSTEAPSEVRVALPLDSAKDFDRMAVGLKSLGRVVLFLDKDSPLVTYDPSLYVVIEEHSLIATVAPDGTLALPMLEPEKAAKFLVTTKRLSDLETMAKTRRVIALVPGPGPDAPLRAEGT